MKTNLSAFHLHSFQIVRSFLASLAFALVIAGCGGGMGGGNDTSALATPSSIVITPDSATVAKGQPTQFTATAVYPNNKTANITSKVTWTSANTTAATVNSTTGVANAIANGSTTVTATLNGITSPAVPFNVSTPTVITRISITPSTISTPKGTPVTFTATGTYSDGTTGNLSGAVAWSSSDISVASLNDSGIASTLAQGSSTITASISGVSPSSAILNVTAPVLATLSITPLSANIITGNTRQFSASGTLTDGTAASLDTLSWTSSDTSVATIDSTGLATASTLGSTNISANSGGIVSNTAVVVVVPPPPAAPVGVVAVSGTNQATVSWTPVTGATSYNIYWNTSSGITAAWTKIDGAISPYVHAGLTAGSTYYYRVSAVNAGGETLSGEVFTFIYAGGNPAGSFIPTGSLATARQSHTATLLSNGKVLVAGGAGSNSTVFYKSAELYDPSTGLFSGTANSMATSRSNHTATLLPNGKVLIAGGFNGYTTAAKLASAELYDPATGLFSATNSMSKARVSHTATLLPNGKVLIIGGSNSSDGYLASTELYDPKTGMFSATGSLSVPRSKHTATLLPDGKVLVAGGSYGAIFLSSAEIYDPSTGLFSVVNGMTTARISHTATLLPNGKVLLTGGFGGTSSSAIYNSSAELYDPATGSFVATGNMATAKYLHAATLLPNGKVLVAGGRNAGYGGSAMAYAELFDPATGTFNATGSMLTPRQYHTITLLLNGKVLATAGAITNIITGAISISSAELYQ